MFRLPPENPLRQQAQLENVLRRAREQPQEHIWIGALNVLVSLTDMKGYSEYRQWVKAHEVHASEEEE